MSKEIENLIKKIKKRLEEIDNLMWQCLREGTSVNSAYLEGLREAYKNVLEELEIIAIEEKMKSKVSAVDFRKLVRASVPRARLKSPSEEEIKEIIEKAPKDWGVKTKSSEI